MWEELTPSGGITAYPAKPELYVVGLSNSRFRPTDRYIVGSWRSDRRFAVVQGCSSLTDAKKVIDDLRRIDHEFKSKRRYSVLYSKDQKSTKRIQRLVSRV